jgi:glycerol-3-phosphate dehydrogenase (NAD(P)+)
MATVAVLGAGMMGSALCVPLVDRGHEVRLIGTHLDGDIISSLKARHLHPTLRLELPHAIQPYAIPELRAALAGVDMIGVGVSSAGVRWAGEQLAPYARADCPMVMITKGLALQHGTLVPLPDRLRTFLPPGLQQLVHPAVVGGPCIAGELAIRTPTCVMLAGRDARALEQLAALLRTPYYRIWTSTELVGVAVCSALKNAYALGVAVAAGLHEARGGSPGAVAMHNYEAAIFAQATQEMQRLVAALGGDPATATGLAGVGDLNVTCNAGRTGRFGRLLGLGFGIEQAIEKMQGATLECLDILQLMRDALPGLARTGAVRDSQLPLLQHLLHVALDGHPVQVPFDRFFGA